MGFCAVKVVVCGFDIVGTVRNSMDHDEALQINCFVC